MQNLNPYAKSLLLGTFMLLVIYNSMAQVPQTVPYQAVARNTSGNLLANQTVSIRFSIHDTTSGGLVVYQETQSTTTNALGLFTANIGAGTPVTGSFAAINWGSGSKFIQIEIDLSGGSSYANMGTSQMMSVPYAQYAASSGTVTGIVPVANGGTGSATQNFVDLSTTQTVAGAKTFSSDLTVNGLTVGRGGGDSIFNTAVGAATLQSNTTGNFNTAVGAGSIYANTTGKFNTAVGTASIYMNTTGESNTAVGAGSIYANDSGSFNTAIGRQTLYLNSTGNYNTANGIYALYSNTSGKNNTANGDSTLFSNTTGSYNTANGSMALSSNTEGDINTAIGILALQSNTMGGGNTAIGLLALHSNTTGNTNTGIGAGADVASGALTNATAIGAGAIVAASNTIQLGNADVTNVKTSGTITAGDVTYPNTIGTDGYYLKMNGTGSASWASVSSSAVPYTGALYAVNLGAHDLTVNGLTVGKGHLSVGDNTAIGNGALHSNTTGDYNTATGAYSLYSNTTGYSNTATGQGALNSNTTGHNNTANGTGALNYNITGNQNTATGKGALQYNLTGSFNTANGLSALETNESGSSNTAYGVEALVSNTTGDGNTAIGVGSLSSNISSNFNTAIGVGSLSSNISGNFNTAIGANADVVADSIATVSNATAIGSGAVVAASNTIQLGNTSVENVATRGTITAGTVTYPNTDGTAGQVLKTNGSGVLSWLDPANGPQGDIGPQGPQGDIGPQGEIGPAGADGTAGADGNDGMTGADGAQGPQGDIGPATAYSGTLPVENGGTGSATQNFVDLTTAQTVAGAQTFSNNLTVNANESVDGYISVYGFSYLNEASVLNLTVTGLFTNTSDKRLKRNIEPLTNSLQTVMQLNPVSYEKKANLTSTDYLIKENGFIAQDLQKVLPILVNTDKSKDSLLSINYVAIIPILTQAIQEQQKQIEALKAQATENNKLKADMSDLKNQNEQLQASLKELYLLVKTNNTVNVSELSAKK